MQYLSKHQESICGEISNRGEDAEILVPVIFPELIRYSLVRDLIETTGLKIFYIHTRGDYPKFANFSIGHFQMKPHFVEKLEQSVKVLGLTGVFADLIDYPPGTNEKGIRTERLRRLENPQWQATYLACFGAVCDTRFDHIRWNSTEEKIRYYSTAYNHGFLCDESEIQHWLNAALFPMVSTILVNNIPMLMWLLILHHLLERRTKAVLNITKLTRRSKTMKKTVIWFLMFLLSILTLAAEGIEILHGRWLASGDMVFIETSLSFGEEIEQYGAGIDMSFLGFSEHVFFFKEDNTVEYSIKYLDGREVWGDYAFDMLDEGWGINAKALEEYDESFPQFDLYFFMIDDDTALFTNILIQSEYLTTVTMVMIATRQK